MNTDLMLNSLLHVTVAVFALSLFWVFVIPRIVLDTFRQDLFAVRDELFDWFLSNNLSLSLPAYRESRKMMNTMIRHAGSLDYYSILLARLMKVSGDVPTEQGTAEQYMTELPQDLQADYMQFICRARLLVFRHIAINSLPGFLSHFLPFLRWALHLRVCRKSGVNCQSYAEQKEAFPKTREFDQLAAAFSDLDKDPRTAGLFVAPA